jgi:hypothetical protein
MGDRLALQYGGSEAHKKVSKGAGKTKQGELLTSIKRYYSNSFTDRVKQDAMNLFLGYFQPSMHDYALWDLETDYFLHNRLLHPPRPDVDAILLNISTLFGINSGRVSSDDSVGSFGRSSVMGNRPTIQDLKDGEKEFQVATAPKPRGDSDSGTSLGVSEAMSRYFYRSTADETSVISRIASIERIKKRLVDKKELVREAEELWWRKAMMDFDNEKLWMKLPPRKDGLPQLSYYEGFHFPHKLTSFDDELNQEFQYPIDATIFAAPKTEASGYWNRRRGDSRKMATLDSPSKDDDDDDDGQEGETSRGNGTNLASPEEFELFSFARYLGSKAQNIVGALLKPIDSENQAPSSYPSADDADRENTPVRAPVKNGCTYSTVPAVFEKVAHSQYSAYCDIGEHPEVFITDKYGSRPRDFEPSMWTHMVGVDDVSGMEQLAFESYIGNKIASGEG